MPTIKKIFLKKISAVLALFIVCGFSLTLGAILLRVVYSAAFQQPTQPPTADPHELGALAEIIGDPGDAAGTDTVFGKIADVSGGTGGAQLNSMVLTEVEYIEERERIKQWIMDKSGGVVKFTTATYNGNLGGIAGANEKCASEFPGYRFANSTEVRTLITGGQSTTPALMRKTDLTGFNYKTFQELGIRGVQSTVSNCVGANCTVSTRGMLLASEQRLSWINDPNPSWTCSSWTDGSYFVAYGAHIHANNHSKMDEELFVVSSIYIGGPGNYAFCSPTLSLTCLPV